VKIWDNYSTDFCDRSNGPENHKSNMNRKYIETVNALIFCKVKRRMGLKRVTGLFNNIYGTDSGTVLQQLLYRRSQNIKMK